MVDLYVAIHNCIGDHGIELTVSSDKALVASLLYFTIYYNRIGLSDVESLNSGLALGLLALLS